AKLAPVASTRMRAALITNRTDIAASRNGYDNGNHTCPQSFNPILLHSYTLLMSRSKHSSKHEDPFWKRHSLSLTASAVTMLWLILYMNADPKSHPGSFFGNALADWTGLVVTVIATKWFFEKGSKESRQPRRRYAARLLEFLHEHSLTVFLIVT